jgi:hypothetical protein
MGDGGNGLTLRNFPVHADKLGLATRPDVRQKMRLSNHVESSDFNIRAIQLPKNFVEERNTCQDALMDSMLDGKVMCKAFSLCVFVSRSPCGAAR